MGYDIRWANAEQTIILCELTADWTWEDLYAAVEQQVGMMASVTHPVHTIFYTTVNKMRVPPNALSHLRRLMSITHPNEDGVVIVGAPTLITTLFSMMYRVYGVRDVIERFMFTDRLEKAYALLDAYEQRTRQKS